MKNFTFFLILIPCLLFSKENIDHKKQLRIEAQIWEIKECIYRFQDKLTDIEYFDLMIHIAILEEVVSLD